MYADLGQVRRCAQQFEICSLPLEQWDHQAHLSVACWYIYDIPAEAEQRMRRGIQRYNAYNGIFTTPTTGYHETLTLFWLSLVRTQWFNAPVNLSPLACINKIVADLDNKMMVLEYYTRTLIVSDDARYGWVAPDLRALPTVPTLEVELQPSRHVAVVG